MTITPKFNYSLNRLSSTPNHHFYGYYGINPWNKQGQDHLALETITHTHRPRPTDIAKVGLINRQTKRFTPYASTSAYNLQQGCMLHWIDEEFTLSNEILL